MSEKEKLLENKEKSYREFLVRQAASNGIFLSFKPPSD
jgi:hypothetical protein